MIIPSLPDRRLSTYSICGSAQRVSSHYHDKRTTPVTARESNLAPGTRHTCATGGRSGCGPCMQHETALWDAINRYAISVGGDPSAHVYGNTSRQQAVADVSDLIRSAVKGGEIR